MLLGKHQVLIRDYLTVWSRLTNLVLGCISVLPNRLVRHHLTTLTAVVRLKPINVHGIVSSQVTVVHILELLTLAYACRMPTWILPVHKALSSRTLTFPIVVRLSKILGIVMASILLSWHGNLLGIVAFKEIELGIWTNTVFEIYHVSRLLNHWDAILDELPILWNHASGAQLLLVYLSILITFDILTMSHFVAFTRFSIAS